MGVELYPHQLKALGELCNGKILCGGVGSGKSRTAIAYYFLKDCGGSIKINGEGETSPMTDPKPLYIITTAKKRDNVEWLGECAPFLLSTDPEASIQGVKVTVDSWNNIGNYDDVKDAFFIFDEQRLVGSGAWVKSFLKIAKANHWILLSATPGDTWMDYAPVFIANGFYKNRTDFITTHVIYTRYAKFPKIDRYVETGRLFKHRKALLVDMPYVRTTVRHYEDITVPYDIDKLNRVMKKRWNPYTDEPIRDAGGLCYTMRHVVNEDPSRLAAIRALEAKHDRLIIFYNFDYELELLRTLGDDPEIAVAEWNGHKHESIPERVRWLYLVQYTSGAEGWNCTATDAVVFYSLNYSYRITHQAEGRIDRLDTKFVDLFYYFLKSTAGIDRGISKALRSKQDFNASRFIGAKV